MAAEVGGRSFDHNLIDSDSDDEIYHDHITNSLGPLEFDSSRSPSPVGGQLPLGNIENNISHQPSFDTITVALSNFHIHTVSSKENIETGKARTRRGRPQIDKNTFDVPKLVTRSEDHGLCDHLTELTQAAASSQEYTQEDFENYNPIAFASRNLPSPQEQLLKHHAATQLDGDELSNTTQPGTIEGIEPISATHATDSNTTTFRTFGADINKPRERRKSEDVNGPENDDMAEHMTLPVEDLMPRIEDSVEALDKLEEELEAATEVAALDRVLSPGDTAESPKPSRDTPTKLIMLPRSNSTAKRPTTNNTRTRTVDRPSSFRKSASLVFSMEEEKPVRSALKKSTVSRPTSLLLPKAPIRSTKPPTVTTFELPGEAVARRLKEQRAARLSQHLSFEQVAAVAATYSPSKPQVKSTKPPTRPTFELPGDAISRRKREEREAKLRAQEEEERKRREFKARPIRTSIVPSSYPRETIASKARRGKLSQSEEPTEKSSPVAKKRQSLTLTGTTVSRPSVSTGMHLSATLPSRGRTSVVGTNGAQISRATSTASTASIHGGSSSSKRSTVSAEDMQQQKLRGKEILSRDNSFVADRERERREREEATKLARKEAAERSRQISREWAEKQRLRKEEGRSS